MAEIPFVFDNIANAEAMTHLLPEAQVLANKMSDAWLAFARTGKPAAKDLPEWTTYSSEHRATMVLDNSPRLENDPARELRLFWLEEERRVNNPA
jgi:para-nitrobenzyl esterase